MAKNKSDSEPRSNRIRFIMLDADISDGNLSELTQAITQALRPNAAQPAPKQITPVAQPAAIAPPPNGNGADPTAEAEYVGQEEQPPVAPARKQSTTRSYAKPNILKDVDPTAGPKSFSDYWTEKGSLTETLKRYLLVAGWFHDFRDVAAISADHVFTCYRSMGWALDSKDPKQPFRDLQRQDRGQFKDGKFEINHIGLGVVQKMAPGATE